MTDIIETNWNELDNANISPAPNGVQPSYPPSSVAPIIRAIRGAVKREFVSSNAIFTSTGAANVYALNFAQPLTVQKGKRISFWANVSNTGASTINLNTSGPVAIVRKDGTPLRAGDIIQNSIVSLVFDGLRYILDSGVNLSSYEGEIKATTFVGNGAGLTNLNASNITSGTLADARLPASMTGKTFTSQINLSSGAPIFQMSETDQDPIKSWFMVVDGGNWSIRENTTGNVRLSITAGTTGTSLKMDGNTVWTAGNGGAGSGMDADLLDGFHANALPVSTPVQNALNLKANTASLGNAASKNFYYGTAVPAANFGAEGDIYFRYE